MSLGTLYMHCSAVDTKWIGIGGNNTEQDFVEAPSQLLEEWTWDASTLATFARHFETGEPIPNHLGKPNA